MGIKETTVAITRDKNARDKPLYVQVCEGNSSLWFVIEDGRQQQHQQEESEKAKIGSNEAAVDDIIFRRLDLPQLDYQRCPRNIVVINSKLYLLGGVKINYRPVPEGEIQFFHPKPARECEFLDLQERRLRWRCQSFGKYHNYTQHMASSKDGLIYGFGPQSYIMNPSSLSGGVVATEPLPKIIDEYGHVPQPLAISNNKIYAYSRGGITPNFQHYLFSYDMKEKKWDCLFKHFWGDWATGVVISGDSYLIAYGSRHPIEDYREKPGVWVFDINRRQWLDEPVEGLDEALPVIPDWVYEEVGYVHVYYLPCLFQIGKHRFALIWEESGDESYKLHCHKFTLQAPASADQPFVAQQLSNKVITLNGGNNEILGCTVGL
ncbi:hypothetical protein ACLB2K_071625 [Fragaria x ananassa]